jgi:hypothetical protein
MQVNSGESSAGEERTYFSRKQNMEAAIRFKGARVAQSA